jgi:molybdopterin-guanine dinucleotide biosynthesis protein A
MGADKANLEFQGRTLLQAVLSQLAPVINPHHTVIVAAADQVLPPLPDGVLVVRDEAPHAGPLAALAVGLDALPPQIKFAAVMGCDTPLISAKLLKALADHAEDFEAVVPLVEGRLQPLLAVYRRDLGGVIAELLAAGKTSLHSLHERVRTKAVDEEALREFDRELLSFRGCNTPEEYAALCTMSFQPVVPRTDTTG